MEDFMARHERQMAELNASDADARAKGKLVGRYFTEQIADGYAFYKIIRESKTTVMIHSVDIMDGYQVPYWGNKATIKRDYVESKMRSIEAWAKLVKK